MGTGGCLGPRKNKDEIFIKMIKEMHEESYKLTHSENLDIYQALREKIVKKGYLKKFVDNLSTRRHKVLESLNLNYKLTVQGKEMERHYVGLIIVDAIMEIVYHSQQCSSVTDGSVFNDGGSDGESSVGVQWSIGRRLNDAKKGISSSYPSRRLELYEQNQTAFDQQYFRLVNYLFENEKKIHYRLLQSLTTFCQKHPGFINCEHFVWKIIERLTSNIKKNIYLNQSCVLFNLLLQRTRDEASENLRNEKTLISVIKIWLIERQSQDVDVAETESNCLQIIKIHFQRCISSWCEQFLYEVIFTIYDNIQFDKEEQILLEKMYEEILENSDLKNHFFRGLFNYLLSYLSVTHQTYVTETDKKWFATSLGLGYQKIRSLYKNVLKDQVKVQCFKLLSSWAAKKYANVDEFCMYNNKALIFVYLANCKYYSRNNGMLEIIMNEYFKIISKLSTANKKLFVDRVVDNFKQEGLSMLQYALLLQLIKETVFRKIFNQEEEGWLNILNLYLIPVWTKYSHELNLEILKLIGFVVQSRSTTVLNEEGKNKLCELLHSIYEDLVTTIDALDFKYQFVCAAVSLFRLFVFKANTNRQMVTALTVFINKIEKELQPYQINKNLTIETHYMLIYFLQEIKSMMVPKDHPKSSQAHLNAMLKINSGILPSKEMNANWMKQLGQEIIDFLDLYFMSSHHTQQKKVLAKNEQELEEYTVIMGRLFGYNPTTMNNKFQLNRKTSRDSESFSVYSRTSACEKCRGLINQEIKCRHMRGISDGSFRDVMDIIQI